jgi:hypothetical protein
MKESCLTTVPVIPDVYEPSGCNKGIEDPPEPPSRRNAEFIAQARAIAWLGKDLDGGLATGVSPDIQWEVVLPGMRPDIILYDRGTEDEETKYSTIYLWEVKLNTAKTFNNVEARTRQYQQKLEEITNSPTVFGTQFSGFYDHFLHYL